MRKNAIDNKKKNVSECNLTYCLSKLKVSKYIEDSS